jgi:hypothetical protein
VRRSEIRTKGNKIPKTFPYFIKILYYCNVDTHEFTGKVPLKLRAGYRTKVIKSKAK